MENIFEITPFLGFYHEKCQKFVDKDIFESQFHKYIRVVKVKVWYGTCTGSGENINGKYILGIQCDYHNPVNGEKKQTEIHSGTLSSVDIITRELELVEGDYITKFNICYNDIISYIKLTNKKNKILELGNYDKNCEKTLKFNEDKKPNMIQCFHGFYNEYGLRALGFTHLKRQNYFFLNLIDVFRFRHKLKINEQEKEKWTEEEIQKLNYDERAFIRLCLLPDSQFSCVIKFCC